MSDYDAQYQECVQEFVDLAEALKIKKPEKDAEGNPCLRPRGKRGEIMEVYPHGLGEAAMSVMGKTQNSKTINKYIAEMVRWIAKENIHPDQIDSSKKTPRSHPFDPELKKKIEQSGMRVSQWGDYECTIVFDLKHLKTVAVHFGLRRRKVSAKEIENQERFAEDVRERWRKKKEAESK